MQSYDRLIYRKVHYKNDLVVHHHHETDERTGGDQEKHTWSEHVRRGISSIADESSGSDEKTAWPKLIEDASKRADRLTIMAGGVGVDPVTDIRNARWRWVLVLLAKNTQILVLERVCWAHTSANGKVASRNHVPCTKWNILLATNFFVSLILWL